MPIHRYLALLSIGLIDLFAGLRLWIPPAPGHAPRCPNPVGIEREGHTTVLCLRPVQPLSSIIDRLGIPACRDRRSVMTGQMVHLPSSKRDCRVRIGPMPAAARLALGLRIDINSAGVEALQALPRIGPVLAARIVAHRRRHGPFSSTTQLQRVRGIGPRTLERLRGLVSAQGSLQLLSK